MKTKYCQFSLSGLFALTIVAATLVSFRGGLTSERSLHAVWCASFLFSYWNSPAIAWRRILRATATTGVVWSVGILWAYCLFVTGIVFPMEGLAVRGVLVALAGVLAAFAAACLVEVVRAVVRRWPTASWPRRVMGAFLLLLPLPAWAVWDAACPARWNPAVVISARQEVDLEVDPVRRVEQQHRFCRHVVGSADGRYLAAILNGSREVLILDGATGRVSAKLATGNDEWFADLTFHPNSRVLAAIVDSDDATSAKLVRWDAPDWISRQAIPLDGQFGRSNRSDRTSFLIDQVLLVITYDHVGDRSVRVTIFTADLLQDHLDPKEFVSATIDLKMSRRRLRTEGPDEWIASPNGKWIATFGSRLAAAQDCVFCAEGPPAELAGRAVAFLSDGDHLLVHERSERLVWKKKQTTTSSPPFWNHLRIGVRYRAAIVDCRKRQVVACSRWFPSLLEPRVTPDRSRFLADHGDAVLVWQIPEF
jgi:hypothetical protein